MSFGAPFDYVVHVLCFETREKAGKSLRVIVDKATEISIII